MPKLICHPPPTHHPPVDVHDPKVEFPFIDGRFREDTFHKLLQGMRSKRDATDMNDFQSTFNTLREDKPKGNFYVRYLLFLMLGQKVGVITPATHITF